MSSLVHGSMQKCCCLDTGREKAGEPYQTKGLTLDYEGDELALCQLVAGTSR